jgi:phosphoglucosamine mutase
MAREKPMKKMTRQLFGTDGIRGKANCYPMTGEVAMALGRAVTYYFQSAKKDASPLIIIGKDTRLSCYMLEQAFASGVCSQGGRAILTGPLPTPGVAFVTQSMRAEAGVMISASHNSFSDNGIKIFDAKGQKLPDEIEQELEKMILNPESLPIKTGAQLGRAKRLDEAFGRYIVHVKSTFPQHLDLDGMRIVLDCANGAGYRVAPLVFSELGAEVMTIGTEPNGENINHYVGSMYPEQCAQKVKESRADIGLCLDGDADRLVVIDRDGSVIDGDIIFGILAKYLVDKKEIAKNSEVVGTVMTNIGLEHFLAHHGIRLHRTQVGDRYIYEQMQKSGAIFGGEPSGHLIFRNHTTTGDGILAALKVIECLLFYKKTLRELADQIELYPQILQNIEVKRKPEFHTIPLIAQTLKDVEKKLGVDGRVLLRYSGTEPKVRVMIEGKDSEQIKELCQELANVLTKELGLQKN